MGTTAVLVIEDEPNIASIVRIALEREGFHVTTFRTGEEGLAELDRHPYALVVLDIGLPGIDGFEVCRRLRQSSGVPVIMLTARDDEVDKVVGLELGADDYVPKPFSPRELVARVKAVLRRVQPCAAAAEVLQHGDLVVRVAEREVAVSGEPVDLTPKEFDLLAFLMAHPGIVFSRDRLLERVWGIDFPYGTRTVDQHVAQLRAKLGRRDPIETVRGVGYKVSRR
ncbi:MAG: response regulator transcription factor [Thermoleophilia bacterium]|nr:response regulator transcription factor [Thermoleophilia bacterium]